MQRNRYRTVIICLALMATTIGAFWPVFQAGFINFDDPVYVTQNEHVSTGFNSGNVAWAFTTGHGGNWHPVTWLSHMLDCQLFGLNPRAQHSANLAFHVLNSVLLFLWLREVTRAAWPSAFVAGFFAVHPLHVESVAWISERKDVLSMLFFLLMLAAWTRYARSTDRIWENRGKCNNCRDTKPNGTLMECTKEKHAPLCAEGGNLRLRTYGWYAIALVLYILGLMSKPMLVTAPFLLLLLDIWPLGRIAVLKAVRNDSPPWGHRALLLEKLPFLALSVSCCVITFIAQNRGGAMATVQAVPVTLRLQNIPVAYATYIANLLWPARLAAYYPMPPAIPPTVTAATSLLLIAISGFALLAGSKRPYLTVGWLWYLGSLIPVIGLIQVGMQSHADRYMYLPSIGFFVASVWVVAEVSKRRLSRHILSVFGIGLVAVFMVFTFRQARFWKDSETLFRHAIAVAPENPVARVNLGSSLVEKGKVVEAEQEFAEAVRYGPGYADARNDLGFAKVLQGRVNEAIADYRAALEINPNMERTRSLLGNALLSKGCYREAIAEYRAALKLNPKWPTALNDLAWVLATSPDSGIRNGTEAVMLGERACESTGRKEPLFLGTLAAAYAEAGRFEDAVRTAGAARDLAQALGNKALANRNSELLELYKFGKPFHEKE